MVCTIRALRKSKKSEYRKACYTILQVPIYLVVLFVVVLLTNVLYVKQNELDKQKEYISTNISFTKQAYDINIEEKELLNTGTVTRQDIEQNLDVINNINIYNKKSVITFRRIPNKLGILYL